MSSEEEITDMEQIESKSVRYADQKKEQEVLRQIDNERIQRFLMKKKKEDELMSSMDSKQADMQMQVKKAREEKANLQERIDQLAPKDQSSGKFSIIQKLDHITETEDGMYLHRIFKNNKGKPRGFKTMETFSSWKAEMIEKRIKKIEAEF